MTQVSATNVFDFMGTAEDVRTQQTTMVNTLIANEIKEIEETIGRRIEKEIITDELFEDYLGCEIKGQYLFLKGKFRDIYKITELKEDGAILEPVEDSNDGKDFYLNARTGFIKRVNQNWSRLPSAIKITADLGLVDTTSPFDTKKDIKQILTEMVAAKSGLWKTNTETEGGDITTIRTNVSPATKASLKKYILRHY